MLGVKPLQSHDLCLDVARLHQPLTAAEEANTNIGEVEHVYHGSPAHGTSLVDEGVSVGRAHAIDLLVAGGDGLVTRWLGETGLPQVGEGVHDGDDDHLDAEESVGNTDGEEGIGDVMGWLGGTATVRHVGDDELE